MPNRVVHIDWTAAKCCPGAGEELVGAACWPVPTLTPGILGITWGVRGRVTRGPHGTLGWRVLCLPPVSPPRAGSSLLGRWPIFNEQITVLVNSMNMGLGDQGSQSLGNSH